MPVVVRSVSSEMPPRGESRAMGLSSWNQNGTRGEMAPVPRTEHVKLMVLPVLTYNSDAPPMEATAAKRKPKERLVQLGAARTGRAAPSGT